MAQKIIVEGDTDIHFITHLCIQKGVKPVKGYENKTKYINEFVTIAGDKGKLKTKLGLILKNPNADIQNLGLVIDADSKTSESAVSTWQSIKSILEKSGYDKLPLKPDTQGTIIEKEGRPKIGIWIMPDNISNGYLEDFYGKMIHANDEFWLKSSLITEQFVQDKINRFREIDLQKTKVHTWLAWQDNPELPLGLSVKANAKYINFDLPLVDDFVDWFKNTFDCG
jgi:hypothetical protein